MSAIVLDRPLEWRQVGAIAEGATSLALAPEARRRIEAAHRLVQSIVARDVRAYGINTGVGALCDVIVAPSRQRELSRNIVMSHAVGVGPALETAAVRAIIAAQINNFAHGYSGVRAELVDALAALLDTHCTPEVPARGSVGYLTHMAHIGCVLLGAGHARLRDGERLTGAQALRRAGIAPVSLEAKEGLSLVNGTPCATGLLALALSRAQGLLDWADLIGAMSFENLRGQAMAFDGEALGLRASPAVALVGRRLRAALESSATLRSSAGLRTQDALSLRAIPQVHGAVREQFANAAAAVCAELESVTDNPVVVGTPQAPRALSEAHAVGAALGLSADALAIALAELAAMSERRIDRLVNPLLSGLPAFLAADGGAGSGFMIAQYTAAALAADNRRHGAPASLDGGVTSALQEDHLAHATQAALKLHSVLDNARTILAIELLAAAQAHDLSGERHARAPRMQAMYRRVRETVPPYRDDRPLAEDIECAAALLRAEPPELP
ncbi:MAG TPA: histidine ammonia-lyase [Steroidobacteraceae bacterium]|nr:histidine ammonia-lyase [Steroidobacteraceae bacterium]